MSSSTPQPTKEQLSKSQQGIVSGVASHVEGAANILSRIPVIGSIAGTVGGIAGTVSRVAKIFGFDKPTSIEAQQPVKLNWFNITHGSGLEQSPCLSVEPANRVSHIGDSMGYSSADDQISNLINRPSIIYAGNLLNAPFSGADNTLLSFPVHPVMSVCTAASQNSDAVSDMTVLYNSTSFVSNLFRYWRGSMDYRIRIMASNFHSARLRVIWIPGSYCHSITNTDVQNYANIPTKVVDIRGDTEICFSIPYLIPSPFARCSMAELAYANEQTAYYNFGGARSYLDGDFDTDTTNAARIIPTINGRVHLVWDNEPTFPSTPVPSIQCIIYSSAGKDMQLSEPTTESFSNMIWSNTTRPGFINRVLPPLLPSFPATGGEVTTQYPTAIAPVSLAEIDYDGPMIACSDSQPEITDLQELTAFEDVDEQLQTTSVPHNPITETVFNLPTIKDVCARPVMLVNHRWVTTENQMTSYDIFSMLMNNKYVSNALAFYRYVKADVKVQIRMNGTSFHYGSMGYFHIPLGRIDVNNNNIVSIPEFSQYSGGVITPDSTEIHNITLPYLYPKQFMDKQRINCLNNSPTAVTNQDSGIGPLCLYPYTALAGGTVTSSVVPSVNLTIYAWLENLEVAGPSLIPLTPSPFPVVKTVVVQGTPLVGSRICNSVDLLLGREATSTDPVAALMDADEPEIAMVGYSHETSSSCPPIIPSSTSSVPPDVLHGEEIANIKQLIHRPGYAGLIRARRTGAFVSHFANVKGTYPMLREYKGAPHSSIASTPHIATTQNTSFLDAFREIFLCERGSVAFKFFGPDGPLSQDLLFQHENMSSWNAILGSTGAGNLDFLPDSGAIAPLLPYSDPIRTAAGMHYIPSTALFPPEVTTPYHCFDFFHFVPQVSALPSQTARIIPFLSDCPGVRVSTTLSANSNTMVAVIKSACDDFQFGQFVPPRASKFTVNRRCANGPLV